MPTYNALIPNGNFFVLAPISIYLFEDRLGWGRGGGKLALLISTRIHRTQKKSKQNRGNTNQPVWIATISSSDTYIHAGVGWVSALRTMSKRDSLPIFLPSFLIPLC